MSRTLAIVMGFALLGFCSAQNCTFLDGECSVSVKYMASLKTTNNDIDIFYTNISQVLVGCNSYTEAKSCDAEKYCLWNTTNSPSCNAPVNEVFMGLSLLAYAGCSLGAKSSYCDFITNTINYCNMTTKDACNAKSNCMYSGNACTPKPTKVYDIVGEVGKSLGSTHAVSIAAAANQCSAYTTSATCSTAKTTSGTNSAASVASGAGMLVMAVAAGLATVML